MGKYIDGLVSVIMPTYRRSETLARAINSVLGQTYFNLELLLVNDNEPDDDYTKELKKRIEPYICDPRFKLIIQEQHINGAVARNVGIRQARGEYIAFLDDDDWWKPNKIEKQVERFKLLDDSFAVVSTLVEFYKNGKIIKKTLPYKTENMMVRILEREIEVTTPSIFVKHICIDEIGGFDENLKRHQEIQFLSFLTEKYKLSLIKEYLTCVGLEDLQNKPTIEQLIEIKADFFKAVDSLVKKLPNREQKCIKKLHRLEIAYRKVQERLYISAIKDFAVVITSPSAVFKAVRRIRRRLTENK